MDVTALGGIISPRCGLPTRNGPCGRSAGHGSTCTSEAAMERNRYVPAGELTLCGVPVRVRPAVRLPAPAVLSSRHQLAMCGPCWDDACGFCEGGTCKCACRDGAS